LQLPLSINESFLGVPDENEFIVAMVDLFVAIAR